METLTIKELAPYLPYGLKCEILNYKSDYVGEKYGIIKGYYFFNDKPHFRFNSNNFAGKNTSLFKPLLRPLSDLTKENVQELRFCENEDTLLWGACRTDKYTCFLEEYKDDLNYKVLEWLYKNHYDVFQLIPKGLAIDLNTIKETVK